MAVVSQGTLVESIESRRFDAEFFRPEFVSDASKLKTLRTTSLAQHFIITDGNHLFPLAKKDGRWFTGITAA